ncbi:hypothetical protein ICN19_08325 [Polynucleobacter sp. AP-Capit-er-40B-B4]|uniref:hypothetical protein n=1 Tax=Polynucleobacter sp. AP-Capit-er-40B-B4 TaxID=2576927 RepID=UPI001C0D3FC0|nr:hypothetical protein [Polynucleobacter sp. AP-Capit-er-40B-B4]MBU3582021.1 hypothetical protein [Polynucleobacter sp. AP-Capit-er-40B-B4]
MKNILLLALLLLAGCAPGVMYKSDPPGAVISGDAHGGGSFAYNTPMRMIYPGLKDGFRGGVCPEIISPTARWPDGTTLPPQNLRICHRESEWTFVKPAPIYQAPVSQQNQSKTVGMDEAKKKCIDLGFKSGTNEFGKCVLQLTK